jgi:hypothetical protein
MPGKEWTDEEVQKEIADAIAIVREDRFETFVRGKFPAQSTDQNGGKDQSGSGGDSGGNDSSKKRKAIWWGDTE